MRFLEFGLEGNAEKIIGSMTRRFLKLGGNDGNFKASFWGLYGVVFVAELLLIDLIRFPDFPLGVQFLLYMTSAIRIRSKGGLSDFFPVRGLWIDRWGSWATGVAANRLKSSHKASGAKGKGYSEQDLTIMNEEETAMKIGIISLPEKISVDSEVDLELPSQPALL
ncbi:MAG: hypothetical protein RXR06_11310 [Thermoproteus sp.]